MNEAEGLIGCPSCGAPGSEKLCPPCAQRAREDLEKMADELEPIKKPPLGLIPRNIWDEKKAKERAVGLAEAISRYVISDKFTWEVLQWVFELEGILRDDLHVEKPKN